MERVVVSVDVRARIIIQGKHAVAALWRLDTQVPDLPSGFPGLWERGDVVVMSWRPLRALQYQNEPPTILSSARVR